MKQGDPYASRHAARPAVRPREDPVVHGEFNALGGLTRPETERYRCDGFLSFERLFGEDVLAPLSADVERLWHETDRGDAAVIREPNSDAIRSIFAAHGRSSAIARLIRDRRLLDIVEGIVGGPAYVHQSRVNYKAGFDGEEFWWHSDFETWHVEDGMPRMRAVSVSLALTDNLAVNGPLMLVPGSHHHYVTCVGATPEDHFRDSLRRQEYGVPDRESLRWLVERGGGIAAPTGPAGSIVLFDCNTMHGSNGNMTPCPRANLFVVYNSIENALVAPFGGTRPRPPFIASRDVQPLTAI